MHNDPGKLGLQNPLPHFRSVKGCQLLRGEKQVLGRIKAVTSADGTLLTRGRAVHARLIEAVLGRSTVRWAVPP